MRGKISHGRERSTMYTIGMMSPADARYLVHGLRVFRMRRETPSWVEPIWSSISSPYPVTDSDTWLLRWRASPSRYRKSRRVLGSRERERCFTQRKWDSHSGGVHRKARFGRTSGWRYRWSAPKLSRWRKFALRMDHKQLFNVIWMKYFSEITVHRILCY